MTADRLSAARERLADALRTGQHTAPLRRAITQLEAESEAARLVAARREAEATAAAQTAIESRAAALVAGSRRHLILSEGPHS